MSTRVYLLLDILEKKAAATVQNLRNTGGVVAIDPLEGHPNYVMIIEAPDRLSLVESMMPVLVSLERVTKDLRLLLLRENYTAPPFFCLGNAESLSVMEPAKGTPMIPVNSLVS
jgi:hypothetical protein